MQTMNEQCSYFMKPCHQARGSRSKESISGKSNGHGTTAESLQTNIINCNISSGWSCKDYTEKHDYNQFKWLKQTNHCARGNVMLQSNYGGVFIFHVQINYKSIQLINKAPVNIAYASIPAYPNCVITWQNSICTQWSWHRTAHNKDSESVRQVKHLAPSRLRDTSCLCLVDFGRCFPSVPQQRVAAPPGGSRGQSGWAV